MKFGCEFNFSGFFYVLWEASCEMESEFGDENFLFLESEVELVEKTT